MRGEEPAGACHQVHHRDHPQQRTHWKDFQEGRLIILLLAFLVIVSTRNKIKILILGKK